MTTKPTKPKRAGGRPAKFAEGELRKTTVRLPEAFVAELYHLTGRLHAGAGCHIDVASAVRMLALAAIEAGALDVIEDVARSLPPADRGTKLEAAVQKRLAERMRVGLRG